jgi:phospholipase/carboxylesterase
MDPHLTARPGQPTQTAETGGSTFQVTGSSCVIYVPPTVNRTAPTGLYVFLHGALRTVDFFVEGHKPAADRGGVIVLAPYATYGTWDAIQGRFSNDVRVINDALQWTFDRWTIDPARIAFCGFSDGATYALAMGRANGDLFSRVVAYAPGFLIGVNTIGKPPILITHGREDTVLPIDQTSRVIVPALRQQGYTVDYREFTGPHAVPLSVAEEVVASLGTQTS